MKKAFFGAAALCLLAPSLSGQNIAEIKVSDGEVEAKVELASGVSADLTIAFEQVVGLNPSASALGLSASEIDPTDLNLIDRLPDGQLTSIPAAFPVLVSIEPPSTGPLSFSGVASIGLHTHDLSYTVNSPLRLFAASAGGPFFDITNTIGQGSYRTGGSKGGFSEFVILADLRPAGTVIDDKFLRVQGTLDDNCTEIEGSVLSELQAHLDSAWSWYNSGDLVSAIDAIDDFTGAVKASAGDGIPNTWRSARDLVNVAGELREQAATLRFSLSLSASS